MTDYWNKTFQPIGSMEKILHLFDGPTGPGFDFWRNKTCAWEEAGKYSMDFYMREAKRILDERHLGKPLFLYFAHQEIHIPLEGPPEPEYSKACSAVKKLDLDGEHRHTLCTMMNRLDKAIGEFVDMLKAKGMWEDTVLWVTTDNGGMTQFTHDFPASASSNYPLRGGKTTLFEGGVRGVSFITGGFLPATAFGMEFRGLLQHVDIPATFAALAGASMPSVDGMDVWDVIMKGAASPRLEVPLNVDVSRLAKLCSSLSFNSPAPVIPVNKSEVFDEAPYRSSSHHLFANFSAIISEDWKLINGYHGDYDGWWSNDHYTHTEPDFFTQGAVNIGGEDVFLFDLSKDDEERHNVAAANIEVVLKLQARLKELSDPSNGYVLPQNNLPSFLSLPMFHNGTWAPWRSSKRAGELLV